MAASPVVILSSPPYPRAPMSSSPCMPLPAASLSKGNPGALPDSETISPWHGRAAHARLGAHSPPPQALAADIFKPFGRAIATDATSQDTAVKQTVSSRDLSAEGSKVAMVREKKPRAKKAPETQTQIEKGKITKPAANDDVVAAKTVQKRTKVAAKAETSDSGSLLLDEALKRRDGSTPPKNSVGPRTSHGTRAGMTRDESDEEDERSGFGDLFGTFGYGISKSSKESSTTVLSKKDTVPRKRQHIEIVEVTTTVPLNPPSTTKKTPKPKAPKKKAKTLTAQATAQYSTDQSPGVSTPFPGYLSKNPGSEVDPSRPFPEHSESSTVVVQCWPAARSGRKSKSTPKPAKRKSGKKKGTQPVYDLLSPESALKHVHCQDFVFGTSSQLAREDSPTVIRELQQAMDASIATAELDAVAAKASLARSSSSSSAGSGTSMFVASRGLWAAASRDVDGSLMEVEVLDLAKSPSSTVASKSIKVVAPTAPSTRHHEDLAGSPPGDASWHHVDDQPGNSANAETETGTAAIGGQTVIQDDKLPEPSQGTKSSSTNKKSTSREPSPSKLSQHAGTPTTSLERPNFAGYASTQLAREIASYGFKPVKARTRMIALLERCWQGKHRDALRALESNATATLCSNATAGCAPTTAVDRSSKVSGADEQAKGSSTTTKSLGGVDVVDKAKAAAKKPRGRPRKNTTTAVKSTVQAEPNSQHAAAKATPARKKRAAKTVIEEISDSDAPPLTPSPPRRSPKSSATHPVPTLQLSTPPTTAAAAESSLSSPPLDDEGRQAQLFAAITRAIRAQPPATDPAKPSWHEKILLYHPIVLEDLATWLNTDGLRTVGVDDEVGPAVCRAWCEGRGICCLWKMGWTGSRKTRQ